MGGILTGLVARPLLALAGAGLLVVAGFGAGELYEHRPHQGLPLSLLGQGLMTQRDEALIQVGTARMAVLNAQALAAGWQARAGQGDTARDAERRNDQQAVQDAQGACEARVRAASARADALARLVTRPPRMVPAPPSGMCPAREVATGAELDQALGR